MGVKELPIAMIRSSTAASVILPAKLRLGMAGSATRIITCASLTFATMRLINVLVARWIPIVKALHRNVVKINAFIRRPMLRQNAQ